MSSSLFSKAERDAVEDSFGDELLYGALEGTTHRVMNGAEAFRLHPAELFYQVFFILDRLKGMPPGRQRAYCGDELWAELYDYLLHDRVPSAPEGDVRLAVSTIMQAVAELLVRSDDPRYISTAAAIQYRLVRQAGVFYRGAGSIANVGACGISAGVAGGVSAGVAGDVSAGGACGGVDVPPLGPEFSTGFRPIDRQELARAVRAYIQGARLYSEEIEQLLDGLEARRQAGMQQGPLQPGALQPGGAMAGALQGGSPSPLRIAKGKMTSMLVMLNAAYRAGWLTGADGQPLPNRDQTLREILQRAFYTDCTHIAQLINPSNNSNEAKNQQLLSRLIDEQECRRFVEAMLAELSK